MKRVSFENYVTSFANILLNNIDLEFIERCHKTRVVNLNIDLNRKINDLHGEIRLCFTVLRKNIISRNFFYKRVVNIRRNLQTNRRNPEKL